MKYKFRDSWFLIKACAKLLRTNKKLVIFPIISSIAIIAVTIPFGLPIILQYNVEKSFSIFDTSMLPFVFIYYFLIYTIIIFLNSALVGATNIRLNGGNPTLSDGIKIATRHLPSILGYSLISSTIGIILHWVQEELGIFGKIFSFIASFAWNVVVFLVVPILVIEGIGPIKAIKRSAELLKKNWGERIIGSMGIGLVSGIVFLGILILFLPVGIYTYSERMYDITIVLGLLFVLVILLLIVISSALNTIYTLALYRYATEGIIHENFDEYSMKYSFKRK